MPLIVAFGNPVYDEITTPTLRTHGRVLSGCSTNGCLALARLGHTTALVGGVGDDYRARCAADLDHYHIAAYLQRAPATGGFRLNYYDDHGNRTLDLLGDAGQIASVPPMCADADAIIIGPIMQETPLRLIEQIRAVSRAPLFLDPQGFLRRINAQGRIEHAANPELAVIAPWCAVIKANELETRVITGIDPRHDPVQAVRQLHTLGCRIAIVTIAEAGSIIDDGERCYRIPPYQTKAHDPTGAGDTYMAGFLHAYLQQPHDLHHAGCTGSATAAIWIEHCGPDAPITPIEVQRRTQILLQSA